jgi:hypothetical protein
VQESLERHFSVGGRRSRAVVDHDAVS